MENEKKKIVYSALKPTGDLQLGNYIGALKKHGCASKRL